MRRAWIIVGWLLVIASGFWLRFHHLDARPFHADEATGARITAERIEDGGGEFDPEHFHGPLLGDVAVVVCKSRGETTWRELRKDTLRLVPATAGLLLVMVPLFWRRRLGDAGALLAGALIACSPLLVYYSRMFIHEMPLALLGMLVLSVLPSSFRWPAAGFFLGLMYATKESFAISVTAWLLAALPIAWERRGGWMPDGFAAAAGRWWKPVLLMGGIALFVSMMFYTQALRHPQGGVDAVMTYFRYKLVEGHDKAFGYYLDLLFVPHRAAGVWWFGTPVAVLALMAFGSAHRASVRGGVASAWARFLGWSVIAHLLIYSLISYKTPWLVCLTWAQLCLLAGFAFRFVSAKSWTAVAAVVALFALSTQTKQTGYATGRLSSDARNPFAYVPTRRDVEKVETFLRDLRAAAPGIPTDSVAVTGSDYWPLPWYLRGFERIGYWPQPPEACKEMPFVFAMPDAVEACGVMLENTHVALPRGIRAGVPMVLHVRNDIWAEWMKPGN